MNAISRAGITSAALASAFLLTLAPANAGTAAPVRCNDLSNGKLCLTLPQAPQRIMVSYAKASGSVVTARVGYRSKNSNTITWDSTWYSLFPGQHISNTWNVSYPCSRDYVGVLGINDGRTFETPAVGC